MPCNGQADRTRQRGVSMLPPIPETLASRLSQEIPDQQAFSWSRVPWLKAVEDAPSVARTLESLPENLDRATVRTTVQENLDAGRVLAAFIPVLVWGGPGGYGPFRARSILTGVRRRSNKDLPIISDVSAKLRSGAEAVRLGDPEEAFRLMNNEGKIKYLGGAFFTKWLAFSSMVDAIDGPNVAPILDKRVRDWIACNTQGKDEVCLSTQSTKSYRAYLDLLEAWGDPFDRTRAQVELSIFELTRDRPA